MQSLKSHAIKAMFMIVHRRYTSHKLAIASFTNFSLRWPWLKRDLNKLNDSYRRREKSFANQKTNTSYNVPSLFAVAFSSFFLIDDKKNDVKSCKI